MQVVKDPIGTKGARLTTHLSIPSRYLVLLPYRSVLGVSVRIEDEAERTRLKDMLGRAASARRASATSCAPTPKGESREALAEDIDYLGKLWASGAGEHRAAPRSASASTRTCSLPLRALRDLMRPTIEKVRVDSRETLRARAAFVAQFMPELAERVEHYPGERPIFDLYGVEDEIQRRCARKCR